MSELHQIVINTLSGETRVAVLEGQRVHRLFIERDRDRDILGNIYLGTVKRVLPGMQSAFVDVGLDRTAFLFGKDARSPNSMDDDLDLDDDDSKSRFSNEKIENLIKENDEIVVQVAKEPLGTKGARITMRISLPGRYVVLVPFVRSIGVSKRIQDDNERQRLREIIAAYGIKDCGFIVRTAAEGQSEAHIQKDVEFLLKEWEETQKNISSAKAPTAVYENLPLAEKTVREFYREGITEAIVVDDAVRHKSLSKFLRHSIPGAVEKLRLYDEVLPLFDAYGIERDLDKAISTRIDLPSGGYLIIEHTEALTSFDVNTGSFVGRKNANDTIFRTNLEAVEKAVEQILIRNLGGIIVLDLIDMEFVSHREKIYNRLNDLLKEDKEKTNVLKISELGLIQMTRKRTSESLEKRLMDTCPTCQGQGRIRSIETLGYDCMRSLMRNVALHGRHDMVISANDELIRWLKEDGAELLKRVRSKLSIKVRLNPLGSLAGALKSSEFKVAVDQ